MRERQLGKDGPRLTEIGMGTWAIGGPWKFGWGPQDDHESITAIRSALDLGINWIDTAAVYGLGHSEEIVAEAVADNRKNVFIATKCGLVWDDSGNVKNNIRPDSIRKEAEDSLRRLKTDYIDLYQIHWPDNQTAVDEAWGAMAKLQDEGKVRFIGVSNFDEKMLKKCERVRHVNSLQPPYNLLQREVEEKILPWCREHETGVVAYSPMRSGLLTGKFDKSRLAEDDWRNRNPDFKEPQFSKNLQFVEELRGIADKYNKTVAQLAIAWVLMNPVITSAIVGARRPSQVKEIIGGADWDPEPEDMEKIEDIRQAVFS